jgi:hypothetical protein
LAGVRRLRDFPGLGIRDDQTRVDRRHVEVAEEAFMHGRPRDQRLLLAPSSAPIPADEVPAAWANQHVQYPAALEEPRLLDFIDA